MTVSCARFKIPPDVKPVHVESRFDGLEVKCELYMLEFYILWLLKVLQGHHHNHIPLSIRGHGYNKTRMIHHCHEHRPPSRMFFMFIVGRLLIFSQENTMGLKNPKCATYCNI